MKSTVLILIAIGIYLIGMLIIGYFCSKRNKNTTISIWAAESWDRLSRQ